MKLRLTSVRAKLQRNVARATCDLVKHTCIARPIREITVKGRSEPVLTYEVLGLNDETRSSGAQTEAARH